MKNRVVKKVERMALVEKVCQLQRDICEYDRFHGDLLIMLVKRVTGQWVIDHGVKGDDYMSWIWDECEKLVQENKELKAKLALQK